MSTLADMTVPWTRFHLGSKEWADSQGSYATVSFDVAPADRFKFYEVVVGKPQSVVTPFGAILARIPLQYPDFPSLYAEAFETEFVGEAGDPEWTTAEIYPYAKARITVNFRTPRFKLDGSEPFLTRSLNFSSSFQAVPASGFEFTDGTPVQENPGLRVKQLELRIVRYWVNDLAALNLKFLNYTGTVNNATLFDYPAETLLFSSPATEANVTLDGTFTSQVGMTFLYKATGWNKVIKTTGELDYIYNKSSGGATSGDKLYDQTDMTQLFV